MKTFPPPPPTLTVKATESYRSLLAPLERKLLGALATKRLNPKIKKLSANNEQTEALRLIR